MLRASAKHCLELKLCRLNLRKIKLYLESYQPIIFSTLYFSKSTGNYTESFTSKHLLEDNGQFADSEKQEYIKWTGAALFIGGGDTVIVLSIVVSAYHLIYKFCRLSRLWQPSSWSWLCTQRCKVGHRLISTGLHLTGCPRSKTMIHYLTSKQWSRRFFVGALSLLWGCRMLQ